VPEVEQRSPTGKFHSFSRNVSLALGGVRNTGTWGGGHPFDFQVRRLPPGAAVCPHHAHVVQWEFFHVLRGTGSVRAGAERHGIRAGDCFLHPPGEAHQLINTGPDDLEVFIVADNPPLDAFYYPDSDKWGLRTPNVFFRMSPVDYFEGEDTVVDPPAAVPPLPAPATPFAQRLRHLDDIAWEDWSSPKGKFRGSFRGVSLAFGSRHRAHLGEGGHPFDVEFGKVPPGATLFPFHWHALQWEFYVFLEGGSEFRLGDARFAVEPGDCVMAAPGAGHQFRNTSDADLHYLVIADDPPVEFWHLPDSGKYGLSSPRKYFRAQETDYLDGEE
jgi:uncharacterized cupin superfamily protein